MTLEAVGKRCSKCSAVKPLSAFYRNRGTRDGRHSWCADCAKAAVRRRQAEVREQMGEQAYRDHRAAIVRRSRERRGMDTEKAYQWAVREATAALVERHRSEYDHLLLLARRGEL